MKKKENKQHQTTFSFQSVKIAFVLINVADSNLIFTFLVVKRLMIIKISVVKIQHPIENHESRPVTSNPAVLLFLGIYTRNITLYKKYYHSQEVLPFTKKDACNI